MWFQLDFKWRRFMRLLITKTLKVFQGNTGVFVVLQGALNLLFMIIDLLLISNTQHCGGLMSQ